MHIRFLGTGAADWQPSDPNFRAFTSMIIDVKLLIDGTLSVKSRIKHPETVRDVIYTHSHSDHFDLEFLKTRAPIRAHIHQSWANRIQLDGVEVIPFDTMEAFRAGDFRVTALPSNHITEFPDEQTVHFVIEKGGHTLFYATDGAWMTAREWYGLQAFRLDGVVFDATIGDLHSCAYRIFEHNSLDMIRLMLQTMRAPRSAGKLLNGDIHPVLKEGAPVFLTHLARTLYPSETEAQQQLKDEFIVGCDGLETDL